MKLIFLPFIVKAVVAGLKKNPTLNTALDEASNEIVFGGTSTSASPPRPTRGSWCRW